MIDSKLPGSSVAMAHQPLPEHLSQVPHVPVVSDASYESSDKDEVGSESEAAVIAPVRNDEPIVTRRVQCFTALYSTHVDKSLLRNFGATIVG